MSVSETLKSSTGSKQLKRWNCILLINKIIGMFFRIEAAELRNGTTKLKARSILDHEFVMYRQCSFTFKENIISYG